MAQKPTTKIDVRPSGENVIEFQQRRFAPTNKAQSLVMMGSLNCNELTSIKALTSYVAHNNNVPEDVVRAFLQAEFQVTDITNLRRDDYEQAVKFLVDLRCDSTIN
jgi:hypothetical protein